MPQHWARGTLGLERHTGIATTLSDYMKSLRTAVGHRLLEVPAAAVAIRDDGGRILLARHSAGNVWVLPGGAIEPEERPAEAAVREVREETGLDVELTRIAGVYGGPEFVVTYPNGDTVSYLMVVFEAHCIGGDERPDGEEVLELRWLSPEVIGALDVAHWMPAVVADLVRGGEQARFEQPTALAPAERDAGAPADSAGVYFLSVDDFEWRSSGSNR